MPDADGGERAHAASLEAHAAASEPLSATLARATWRALGGGLAGGLAMALNVALLMPLRTVMTYQMRHGGHSMREIAASLLREGGFRRLYAGVAAAAVQAPLSRFSDTAANAGALALLGSLEATRGLPLSAQTAAASCAAASFRVLLTPVDAVKTVLQADGRAGLARLAAALRAQGPRALFAGAGATAANVLVAHFSFFAPFNILSKRVPKPKGFLERMARNAVVGFAASVVSDCVANPIRVIKTRRMATGHGYAECTRDLLREAGAVGFFTRGLRARIAANGMQGLLFGVVWRLLDEEWVRRHGDGMAHAAGTAGAPSAAPGSLPPAQPARQLHGDGLAHAGASASASAAEERSHRR